MAYCRYCGNPSPEGARFCQYCGAPLTEMDGQPAPVYDGSRYPDRKQEKRKKPLYKRWWFWILVLAVLGTIVPAHNGIRTTPTSPTYTPSTQSTRISSPQAQQTQQPQTQAQYKAPQYQKPQYQEPAQQPQTQAQVQQRPQTQQQQSTYVDDSTVRPEVKEFLDTYETFIGQYVTFLQKYSSADPSSMLAMLVEYYNMLAQLEKYQEQVDALENADLTNAEVSYYIEVTARCYQKLLGVSTD